MPFISSQLSKTLLSGLSAQYLDKFFNAFLRDCGILKNSKSHVAKSSGCGKYTLSACLSPRSATSFVTKVCAAPTLTCWPNTARIPASKLDHIPGKRSPSLNVNAPLILFFKWLSIGFISASTSSTRRILLITFCKCSVLFITISTLKWLFCALKCALK